MDTETQMTPLERMHLILEEEKKIFKISSRDRHSVLWAWFWRSIVITLIVVLIAGVTGGIIGFVVGFAIALSGNDVQEYQLLLKLLGGLAGVVISFFSLAYFIDWITKSNLGKYRFVMIEKL